MINVYRMKRIVCVLGIDSCGCVLWGGGEAFLFGLSSINSCVCSIFLTRNAGFVLFLFLFIFFSFLLIFFIFSPSLTLLYTSLVALPCIR